MVKYMVKYMGLDSKCIALAILLSINKKILRVL